MTIAAAGNVKSFDFYDFYFGQKPINLEIGRQLMTRLGCGLNDHTSAVVVETGCALSVSGYYANNKVVPAFPVVFAPTSPTASKMILAQLPKKFVGLQNVTIAVSVADNLAALTVLGIDNLRHRNHY